MVYYRFAGLDLCYADPAQPLTTAGDELDDLDHDLSDLSEVCIWITSKIQMTGCAPTQSSRTYGVLCTLGMGYAQRFLTAL